MKKTSFVALKRCPFPEQNPNRLQLYQQGFYQVLYKK